MNVREGQQVKLSHNRCPYCHDDVRPGEEKQGCDHCMAWFHKECWTELGERCPACHVGEQAASGREAPSSSSSQGALSAEAKLAIRETGYGFAIVSACLTAFILYHVAVYVALERDWGLEPARIAGVVLALIGLYGGAKAGHLFGLFIGWRRYRPKGPSES